MLFSPSSNFLWILIKWIQASRPPKCSYTVTSLSLFLISFLDYFGGFTNQSQRGYFDLLKDHSPIFGFALLGEALHKDQSLFSH